MAARPIRRWLALAAGLACALTAACSRTAEQARRGPAAPATPAQPPVGPPDRRAAAGPQSWAGKAARAPKEPERKKPATGPARQHPFRPVAASPGSQQAGPAAGALVLKGICGEAGRRAAVIQEGKRVHFVRVNDRIGHLTVVAIRDGQVVLSVGQRTQILSLYDGPAD